MLRLESHCYSKSCPGPTLSISLRLDGHKSFLVCFKSLLDFLKWHLHIVHSQPSVLLVSHISLNHIIVTSWVPSCILPSALMTHVNHQGWSNTQDSVVHFLRHVSRISPMTLCIHPVLPSKRTFSIMPIRKIITYLISYNSKFYFKIFYHGKISFRPFQIWVSWKFLNNYKKAMFIRASPAANHHPAAHLFHWAGPISRCLQTKPRAICVMSPPTAGSDALPHCPPCRSCQVPWALCAMLDWTPAPALTLAGPFQSVKPSTVSSSPPPTLAAPWTRRWQAAPPPLVHHPATKRVRARSLALLTFTSPQATPSRPYVKFSPLREFIVDPSTPVILLSIFHILDEL
jgi:hypothetical protein